MKTIGILAPGLLCLALASPAPAAAPLEQFVSGRGEVVVEYERATGADAAFARLAADAASVPVRVLGGAEAGPARDVADAYADGLRAWFADVAVVDGLAGIPHHAVVVQVAVSEAGLALEGSEKAYEIRQTGVACKSVGNTVECADGGGAPMEVGKRASTVSGRRVQVAIRLEAAAEGAERAPVFEDTYAITYPEAACHNGVAAAAAVARALAGDALSKQPVNIRFSSSSARLHCGRK